LNSFISQSSASLILFRPKYSTLCSTLIIYIAPLKALAKERIIDWKLRLGSDLMRKSVLELTGDCTPDLIALKEADLLITTPEKWDGISRNW